MRISHDLDAFYEMVGLVYERDRLQEIGLPNNDITATFYSSNVIELVQFCQNNPEYHVISHTGEGFYINHYVKGFDMYQLGEGENDPNIVLDVRDQMGRIIQEAMTYLLGPERGKKRV